METSEFLHKLGSKYIWYNIVAMVTVCILLVVGIIVALDKFTNHGQAITIPDLKGHSYADAEHVLQSMGLTVEIVDTGYVSTMAPDVVLQQSPEAGMQVKEGRLIMLTINSAKSPTLTFPNVVDNCSYRTAVIKLKSMGFRLTEPEYMVGEKDWVYGAKCGLKYVVVGEAVGINSAITLVVGNGETYETEESLFGDDDSYEDNDVVTDDGSLIDL